ncbi:MAG: VOC family protein [Oscillospiraceae bacterium]|jgi:lactoylglutathione lyase|nr:VOC family protein [Oscillospiraceae bacterium]
MEFSFNHTNINVTDLDRSIKFYQDALGLTLAFRFPAPDGSFEIAFMGDGKTEHRIELTWLKDHPQPYDLSDNEIHIAFAVKDTQEALEKHREMGCVCMENAAMGLYFIEDPDGYWLEIVPAR